MSAESSVHQHLLFNDVAELRNAVLKNPKLALQTIAESGSTTTLNLSNASCFDVTLTDDCVLTIAGAVSGLLCSIALIIRQDNVGAHDLTWPSSVMWSGGVAPSLSSSSGATDIFTMLTVDGGTSWFCHLVGANFS
jgi:hypothetical protein